MGGMYVLPVRSEKIEAIPGVMESVGLPLVRTENKPNGVHYLYAAPPRSNGRPPRIPFHAFWITHEKDGRLRFFMGGHSREQAKIVEAIRATGIFDEEGNALWRAEMEAKKEKLLARSRERPEK